MGFGLVVLLAILDDKVKTAFDIEGRPFYATKDGTGWHIESIDTTNTQFGAPTSIAVDSNGQTKYDWFQDPSIVNDHRADQVVISGSDLADYFLYRIIIDAVLACFDRDVRVEYQLILYAVPIG